jgi:HK97 family phage major capsid protein
MATANDQLLEKVTRAKLERRNRNRPVTQSAVVAALKVTFARMEAQRILGEHPFDFARAIRGISALRHNPIVPEWAESDLEYARALSPSTTPGSYLVPVAAADAILSQLAQTATGRASGARIWPMRNLQDLNIPAAISAPQFIWQTQNSRQSPTDPNLTGIAFSLKLSQALILMPVQLFRTALPQWSTVLADSFSAGLAEAEDVAMHASATLVNAPLAIMSQAGITILNAAGGAASGGAVAYGDLLAVLQKAVDLKTKPPYAWYMAGRTWLRLLSINDTSSRPILIPATEDTGPQVGHLLGWPVYLTTSIPTNEAVSSGTNQSHIIFTNPKTINIAESGDVTLAASTDFALDSAEVAVRVGHYVDFGYQPAASIIALVGIN